MPAIPPASAAIAPPSGLALAAVGSATGFGLVMLEPAFWGFVGALIYGGFELVAKLWGADAAADKARKLAIARFFIGLVLGTAAAQEFSLPLQQLAARLGVGIERGAVCLGLGLTSLYLYPIVVAALGKRVRRNIEGSDR